MLPKLGWPSVRCAKASVAQVIAPHALVANSVNHYYSWKSGNFAGQVAARTNTSVTSKLLLSLQYSPLSGHCRLCYWIKLRSLQLYY